VKKSYRKLNFEKLLFFIIRYLLNQGKTAKNELLIILWAFVAFIIISCLSAGILSTIVAQEEKTINTFEELIDSNLTIISGNGSLIYWIMKYIDSNSNTKFQQLENRIKFMDDSKPVMKFFFSFLLKRTNFYKKIMRFSNTGIL
jgi:predicted PurR-regulated permease PerM